jgi:hypothetical protein
MTPQGTRDQAREEDLTWWISGRWRGWIRGVEASEKSVEAKVKKRLRRA